MSGSIVVPETVYSGWKRTSPSRPTRSAKKYPMRAPPPARLARLNALSYLVYAPNRPSSNWLACCAASGLPPPPSAKPSVIRPRMRSSSLEQPPSGQLVELDAPILRAPRRRRVRGDGTAWPVPLGHHACRANAPARQVGAVRVGPGLRQPGVHGGRAGVIGVAGDLDPNLRVIEQRLRHDVEQGVRLGSQRRLAGLEGDPAQDDRPPLRREQDRAAEGVDARARGGPGALVDAVVDAVAVAVHGATARIDVGAGGRVGALVEAVVDAVAVTVHGAAAQVDRGAQGCGGAGVALVRDPVAVAVDEAARAGEQRQADRRDDVARPGGPEGRVGLRRVDAARFQPQGHTLSQEDAVAQSAVDGVVGEAVGGLLLEVEPRVSAQGVEQVVRPCRDVQHQTGTAETQLRRGGVRPCPGGRRLIAGVHLDADDVAEEIAQPPAATGLIAEVEGAVVAREGAEGAELELMPALRAEGESSGDGEQSGDSEDPHRRNPPFQKRADPTLT